MAGSPVDLIGQDYIGKQGALSGHKFPALGPVDHGPGQVGGKKVRSKLNALKPGIQYLGQCLGGQGLGEAGDALDKHVASGQKPHHHALQYFPLADYPPGNLLEAAN